MLKNSKLDIMTKEKIETFYNFETSLHKKEVRNSREKVSKLIADDFIEFGKSGSIFNKQSILDELEAETFDLEIKVSDFEVKELSANVILVTYTSTAPDRDNRTVYSTNRSSIWILRDDRWQMVFHQGTKK